MTIKSIRTGWTGISALAGNPVIGDFESIATVTVGSGGQANVEFTSIPSGYTHLQIRGSVLSERTTYGFDGMYIEINGDQGANYAYHSIGGGQGSTNASAGGQANQNYIYTNFGFGTTVQNYPAAIIVDILDYANTNKHKTIRVLNGVDLNGAIAGFYGGLRLTSGLWRSGNAITGIRFRTETGNDVAVNSRFALYGIRG